MKEFFRSNPKPKKLRALFCFTKQPSIFSLMARLEFKLLQVLVVVIPRNFEIVTIPDKIGNMSCLHYLRLERLFIKELPNSIVKLKCLETLDVKRTNIRNIPSAVWESKQLRHLLYGFETGEYSGFFTNISPFCPNKKSSLPNNLQTLMWLPDRFFQPRLLHRLTDLRQMGIQEVPDSIIKLLSISSPVPIMLPNTLEVLKLYFSGHTKEQINLSCYQNVVKLHLFHLRMMPNNSVAFPPNLVKTTLVHLMVDSHLLSMIKKLPKLKILKMRRCRYDEGKMDLSGDVTSDSFPQLEVLHFVEVSWLTEVTCTDDVSMPKLNKALLCVEDRDEALHEIGKQSYETVLSLEKATTLLKAIESLPVLIEAIEGYLIGVLRVVRLRKVLLARYVPDLKKNLISVSQLDNTVYTAEFGKGAWKVVRGAMVVARGTRIGTLYTTVGCINMVVVAEGAFDSCLWHNRLGHISAKGMKMLAAKRALEGMNLLIWVFVRAVLWANRNE
ncbi:putative disease resistance RPP13-like protein 3-like isoform X1 [Capsicum annuum]|nr:putative disease resistance RPP13-like protein 3-like isoform X1 [Capsicum annuum]